MSGSVVFSGGQVKVTGLQDDAPVVPGISSDYQQRFDAAVQACDFGEIDRRMLPANFTELQFGWANDREMLLCQPPISEEIRQRGYWYRSEVTACLESPALREQGLKPAKVMDLLRYAASTKEDEVAMRQRVVVWMHDPQHALPYLSFAGLGRKLGMLEATEGLLYLHYQFLVLRLTKEERTQFQRRQEFERTELIEGVVSFLFILAMIVCAIWVFGYGDTAIKFLTGLFQ